MVSQKKLKNEFKCEPTTRLLKNMVEEVRNGEIELPLLQRDYVWKPKKIEELLDSLFNGWPIGSFYLWDSPGLQQKTIPLENHGSDFDEYDYNKFLKLRSHEMACALNEFLEIVKK